MRDGLDVAREEPVLLECRERRDLGHVMEVIIRDNKTSMRQF
jgi:hypothetical protein